ncbi:MAG: TonB-dependent receptor plug domain-containing protein [Caldithrix sp.]|nr:TonB-dependent receptor plug domain-containing protein [Caldithrix sp.]
MRMFAKLWVFLIVLVSTSLFAGNTGKIVGRVIDKSTGEPLPGANVIVKDTQLGASTDLNGEFFIINVPPGTYTVECMMVGYQTIRYEDVKIQSDQTTGLDFKMSEQTLEMDEEITVIAERPMVRKDLTASKKVTSAEEIEALPVETFEGIMLTQAGVTKGAGGEIHIRGGRSNEIAYLVDGVSVENPYSTNGLGVRVANNAIQEMSVVSGAFNAEYGNAMSGVVNLTTKDGGKKFNTFFSAYSGDYLSTNDALFLNIDDVDAFANHNIEGTFSGPLAFLGDNKNHTFFLSARYSNSEGYLYGVREHLPTDSANFNLKTRITQYKDDFGKIVTIREVYDDWYIELNGDGKVVPMNPSESINLLGKMKFEILPNLKLRIQSIFNDSKWENYVHTYKFNPEGTYNYFSNGWHNSFQLTHTLSQSTFYELKGAFKQREFRQYVYEDPTDPRYAPTDKIQGSTPGATFAFGGTQMGHVYSDSRTYLGKFDITSQLNKRHLVKSGIEARLYQLDNESFTIQYDRNLYNEPTVLGLNSPSHDKYETYPRQISAYIQDKIEYSNMIVNAGLRYDYFYSDFEYSVNQLQPDGERKQATPKHMFSPRLGVSFPITAKGIIHFSYGHFYQMPSLSSLYVNPEFELPTSGTPLFGNANLRPQQTVIYEVGLKQQLGDRYALDVTGFYKDIRDLLAQQTITFRSLEGDRRSYSIYRNQDYGNVKGITVSFNKRMYKNDPIAATIDYTYQIAEGNDNSSSAFFYNSLSGRETIKHILPLDWDQTHSLSASVTLQPFTGLNMSIIGFINSGYPYTPDVPYSTYDALPNSERKPVRRTLDLRTSYSFHVADIRYELFVKIYNLFDTKNERYVFDDTGRAGYTYFYRNINETEEFKEHYGEPGVHTYDEYITRPHYYTAPREVRVGFSVQL